MAEPGGSPLTAEQHELAAAALLHAIAKDYDAATAAVNQIGRASPRAIPLVLVAWIDTVLLNTGFDPAVAAGGLGGLTVPGWYLEDGADPAVTTDADQVEWPQRWAGRLFAARINDDPATFRALLASVPTDQAFRVGVAAVLNTAAATIRTHRAGGPAGMMRLPVDG